MSAVHDPLANARLTGYGRPGFATQYDEVRPHPPAALAEALMRLVPIERPSLVVDLGSGTGISTMLWAPYAEQVIGVEPVDEMRHVAEARHRAPNVRFVPGVGQATGVTAGAADIVTCGQSLHHMEPEGTLTEVERILRPGGLFAAYDYDVPPDVDDVALQAYDAFMARVDAIRGRHGITTAQQRWSKDEHVARLERRFSRTRELHVQHVEPCTAERWVAFALTIGVVLPLFDLGLSDEALGLEALRRDARRVFGASGRPWHVRYRVRAGIK